MLNLILKFCCSADSALDRDDLSEATLQNVLDNNLDLQQRLEKQKEAYFQDRPELRGTGIVERKLSQHLGTKSRMGAASRRVCIWFAISCLRVNDFCGVPLVSFTLIAFVGTQLGPSVLRFLGLICDKRFVLKMLASLYRNTFGTRTTASKIMQNDQFISNARRSFGL